MIEDAEHMIRDQPPGIKKLVEQIYTELVDRHGCLAYVKTIYIGFEIQGEMVAALYTHPKMIEIALALPEDRESRLLVDATHLTWRSLPVAAELTTDDQLVDLLPLLAESAQRVRDSTHDVNRDPEHFIGRSRRLTDPKLVTPGETRSSPKTSLGVDSERAIDRDGRARK